METREIRTGERVFQITFALMFFSLMLAAILFVRKNLRQGRGDRKGAFRISLFLFTASLLSWLVSAHHAGKLDDWFLNSFLRTIAFNLFIAGFLWLLYMALEPYLRRRIPELLIGWARLLDGRFRDPRVGRDILIGAMTGSGIAFVGRLVAGLPTWFPIQGQPTLSPGRLFGVGGTNSLSYLLGTNTGALFTGFFLVALYFVFRVVLRKPPLAVAALGVVSLVLNLGGRNTALAVLSAALSAGLWIWLITRVGLLATVTMQYFTMLMNVAPPSLDFSSWYAAWSLPGLVFLVALTLYAFHISLGGQPLFGAASLDD